MAAVGSASMRRQGARLARRARDWLQPQVSIGAREQREQAVLLLAVAVVVAPHFQHLPLWSTVVIGLMWIWRAWLTQTLKPGPDRAVMAVLLAGCCVAVWAEHGTLFGRDASVNLLLVLIGLKVLEMRAHRDVLVIVFLSLFVLQTQFLYDQGMVSAALMVIAVAMLFFVLLSVNLTAGDISLSGKVRFLLRIFLQAIPLALTFFFLFPRLSAPLWRAGAQDSSAATGLSNQMAPGSIRKLLANDAVALRAKFDHRVPAQHDLYWRGPVMSQFDGRTWQAAVLALDQESFAPARTPEVRWQPWSAVDYTVTLEPTHQSYLIALDYAAAIDDVPTRSSRLTETLELQTAAPVNTRLQYRVHSYTSYTAEPNLRDSELRRWLQLPEQPNPRTRRWAEDLRQRVQEARPESGATDRQLVNAVLAHFRNAPFRYSIEVPQLTVDPVDAFLFDSQVGYCEHYASAFVVLMRAMGIPARVVTGYQGGEINPVDGYFTVRQSDAHAWAEVWLRDNGWQRVDPTAAVSPSRIERTLHDRRAEESDGDNAGWSWLQRLRLDREALENAWNQWILTFSAEKQRNLISRIGLNPSSENIAILSAGILITLLSLLAVASLRQRRTREPFADLVLALRAKLDRAGLGTPATMGLADMQSWLESRLEARSLPDTRALLTALRDARYARPSERRLKQLRELRARLRHWRPVPQGARRG